MKRMIRSATTVRTYQNKRNPNKYVEEHNDGYGHRSLKQYMQWDTENGTVTNPTGDRKLHRWRKANRDDLLEDYEEVADEEDDPEVYGSTRFADIDWSNPPATYIQEGLYWSEDGHEYEVVEMLPGNKCRVTESWIAEDSGKDVKKEHIYKITVDPVNKTHQEYMYDPKYPEYSRMYASNAFNYPWGQESSSSYEEEFDDYEEDDYTPSSTRGDYSPSNPWDAPGMSVSDFI